MWDVQTGAAVNTLTMPTTDVQAIAFAPDGRRAAAVTSHQLAVWDAAGGQPVRLFPPEGDFFKTLAFTPDGGQVITASSPPGAWNNPGSLRCWDIASGTELNPFTDDVKLRGITLAPTAEGLYAPPPSGQRKSPSGI